MTKWVWGLAALIATSTFAKPVDVDLSPERATYEAKARPRNIGLTLLGISLASFTGGGVSTWYASSARTQLLLQHVPVDLAHRQDLIVRGTTSTVLAAAMVGVGIALSAAAIYFLAVSF